jgi:hypothetical protein
MLLLLLLLLLLGSEEEKQITDKLITELEIFFMPANAVLDDLIGRKTGYPTFIHNETDIQNRLNDKQFQRLKKSPHYYLNTAPNVKVNKKGDSVTWKLAES